jgi:hypothetical protein
MHFLKVSKSAFLVKILLLVLVLASLSACATVKQPLTGLVPGREVESVQSPIGVSVTSGEHTTSGHGFLIFRQPDRFHMALLSPFGLTVFEIFIDKDRLTCLVPSRQVAYSGLFSQLPEGSILHSMALMKWVIERPPIKLPSPGSTEMTDHSGDHYYFEQNGLIDRKVSPEGDEVSYQDYRNIDGAAFPENITIASRYGATVKISFDEPRINESVEDAALVPNLEGYSVQPLANFKGF